MAQSDSRQHRRSFRRPSLKALAFWSGRSPHPHPAALHVIRQGRCTLVATLQMNKILPREHLKMLEFKSVTASEMYEELEGLLDVNLSRFAHKLLTSPFSLCGVAHRLLHLVLFSPHRSNGPIQVSRAVQPGSPFERSPSSVTSRGLPTNSGSFEICGLPPPHCAP